MGRKMEKMNQITSCRFVCIEISATQSSPKRIGIGYFVSSKDREFGSPFREEVLGTETKNSPIFIKRPSLVLHGTINWSLGFRWSSVRAPLSPVQRLAEFAATPRVGWEGSRCDEICSFNIIKPAQSTNTPSHTGPRWCMQSVC